MNLFKYFGVAIAAYLATAIFLYSAETEWEYYRRLYPELFLPIDFTEDEICVLANYRSKVRHANTSPKDKLAYENKIKMIVGATPEQKLIARRQWAILLEVFKNDKTLKKIYPDLWYEWYRPYEQL